MGIFRPIFPRLSWEDKEGGSIFKTDQGQEGVVFSVPSLDLEAQDIEGKHAALSGLFSELPEGMLARVEVRRDHSRNRSQLRGVRQAEVSAIGWLETRTTISFERDGKTGGGLLQRLSGVSLGSRSKILDLLPHARLKALGARALQGEEARTAGKLTSVSWDRSRDFLDHGSHVTGCVRIYRPGNHGMDRFSVLQLLDRIPLPYRVVVSLKKLSKAKADLSLRMQANRQAVLRDVSQGERIDAVEEVIRSTQMQGEALFDVEWLLFLERGSESELRRDLEQARGELSLLGDSMIETFGLIPALQGSVMGGTQGSTFREVGSKVSYYLPIFSLGAAAEQRGESDRSVHFHRIDGSLHAFDLFDKKYLAYNALITGKSGSGKSVLANLVSQSLLADPNVLLIKVDVGGSYRKECELFGGQEINFSLDRPSGVDPFLAFSETKNSNLALETLKQFLATLVKEEGETDVSKEIHAGLEEALIQYRESLFDGEKASLDGLLESCPLIPRRKLLGRWAKGGVFSNALVSSGEKTESNYRYYNFENILGASSRDYAEGVMAAVIAQVNLEMLKAGDRLKNPDGKRIVLFCDETRFFIERNAEFFLLTTANFRKFGHGVILINQNMRNFELPGKNGERDLGIILNSPIRFLLQADHEPKYLKEQFGLCDEHISILTENPYRGREYREVILQDDTGTRALRVYLTPSEYWRCTSDSEDNQKLFGLMRAVPGLTLREAISCLSRG